MNEKTNKTIVILLAIGVAVLIIMNINLNNRLGNIEFSYYILLDTFNNSLYSMNQDISAKIDSINNVLAQEAKLTFDETAFVRDYQPESTSAYVDIAFNFKQFNPNDTVTVVARGINGKTFDAVAKGTDTGRFTAAMTLPVEDRYSLSFASVGAESLSGELTTLDLAEELCGRFKYDIGTNGFTYYPDSDSNSNKPYKVRLYTQFANYTKGNDALNIKEITLVAESEGTELARWDLLPLLQENGDSQRIDAYHREKQILSGEVADLPSEVATEIEVEKEIEVETHDSFIVRLLFTDNIGVSYEQTNTIYVAPIGGSNSGGGSSSGVNYGGTSLPRLLENGEYGEGYIHFAN